jgi:hypothetical protein
MFLSEFQVAALTLGAIGIGTGLLTTILDQVLYVLNDQLKSLLHTVLSLVVIHVRSPSSEFAAVVSDMAGAAGFNTGHEEYTMSPRFVRPLQEHRQVMMHWVSKTWRLWKYRNKRILVVPADDGTEVDLYWLRGGLDRKALLRDIEEAQAQYSKDNKQTRFTVHRHYGSIHKKGEPQAPDGVRSGRSTRIDAGWSPVLWNPEDLGEDVQGVEIEALSITPVMQSFIDRVRHWHEDRQWYRDRGIAHQLGALFYGPPGTGKTATARGVASDLDLPVHVIDLASMTNRDLYEAWAQTRSDGPRMVLMEDFGNVFKGRVNVAVEKGGVTFDALLEVIGGIEREDGLLLVITTNHLEEIDEALGVPTKDDKDMSTRPGRLDLVLEFNGLDRPGRVKLANKILRDQELAERVADELADKTPAQIQDHCIKLVLAQKRSRVAA